MGGEKDSREIAAEILWKVESRKAYADVLLDHSLKRFPLPARDRAFLTQLVYGTLRWRGTLDWYLNQLLHRSLSATHGYLRNLLRLTLYQLLFLDKVPDYAAVHEGVRLAKKAGGKKAGDLLNSVARRLLREKSDLAPPDPHVQPVQNLSARWSHPDWLVERWLRCFGRRETAALLKANNDEAPLVIRAHALRIPREELILKFHDKGLDAEPTRFSPQGIRLRSASAVDRLPGYDEGLFQVQGEASQLAGFLLDPRPGERVLDACAAPGGKTTHLAELMEDQGDIIATDISTRGLERLAENVQRLRLGCIRWLELDVTREQGDALPLPFDRILVDAPCTGLGTLRSHPEAKWHRTEKDVRRLSRLQQLILDTVSHYLKRGGVLVYATCTLTSEENQAVVESFLEHQTEFVLEEAGCYLPQPARSLTSGAYFLALPHKHDTEGFFAARMRKVG